MEQFYANLASTWIGYSGAFGSIGTDWVIVSLGSSIHNSRVMWGGSSLSPIVYNNTVTSIVSGAYEYGKGSFGATLHFGTKNFPETVTSYSIRRRTKATTTTTTINVNTNVSAGSVPGISCCSLNHFMEVERRELYN